ncbi:uncharacterized protein MICPUCDRAFT_67713 [Micromonas pusilla CCMP1545]|uniref:Predicted protein n=2 Tax=Micromonas pusilla TaxID=38833 RepID=C1N9M8_MICPC|nr:uncharacterized protein MICPUCDRAFT_67713 [Micromonas pusilla CCMP1545]EEH51098.1 predicted protein [Micromonas pusilla CCMP1545]|eukprot:XP_003064764.1 predicted protein [Micromonas pusilla CCMP1545]
MTAHLGLDCPPPPLSWMKVGEETKHWEDGVGMAADTSFIHSTYNDSEDRDRFVLIVRFWHPELTAHERDGVRFLFDAFEDLSPAGLAAAAGKARARVASRESADEHGRSGSGADEADAAAAFKSAVSAKVSAPQSGEEEEENGTRGGGGRRKKGRKKKAKGGGGKGLGLLAKGMK